MLSVYQLSESSQSHEPEGVGPPLPLPPDDPPPSARDLSITDYETVSIGGPSESLSQEVNQMDVLTAAENSSEGLMEQDDSEYFNSSSHSDLNALDTDEDEFLRPPPDLRLPTPASNHAANSAVATSENSQNQKNTNDSSLIEIPENCKTQKKRYQ
ncbi:CIC11C00000003995 [Sungouiella intermedia]|uniref:CIC11C00000003995 n=1 Tax=Sungouiella intermedia TaxID=45354 RepID=A0A1L0DBL7_9ASCO|nr:CIC11C00000003995 [[Candida] intermedia]